MNVTIREIRAAAAAAGCRPAHAATWAAIAVMTVGPWQIRADTAGDHRTHLDGVSAVTGDGRDPGGVEGQDDQLPEPTPPSEPAGPGATPDDRSTEDLQREFGTDPLAPDASPEATPGDPADPDVDTERPSDGEDGEDGEDGPNGQDSRADAFVAMALGQRGDSYRFGAEASPGDADPDAFDNSELTQWAAGQVGVTIPDGTVDQYLALKGAGQLMSVAEALRTTGALLFSFSTEPTPGGGRPSVAHVAISLGDGRTVEARGSSYGVEVFPAAGRFNYAGAIPEMTDPLPGARPPAGDDSPTDDQPDSDGDGLTDAFERLTGSDPYTAYGEPEAEQSDPCPPVKAASATRRALDGVATRQVTNFQLRLSIRQIYEAARVAGFTPEQATTWTAIALAESGGETGALDDDGGRAVGLWQIRVGFHRPNTWGDLHDPLVNARAAYEISLRGTDMRPWTSTHDTHAGTARDYRSHLDDVSAVTGYPGDPSGTQGHDLPCP